MIKKIVQIIAAAALVLLMPVQAAAAAAVPEMGPQSSLAFSSTRRRSRSTRTESG